MRISRQPSAVEFMPDQKELRNVKYLRYVASMITSGTRSTREIKSRIDMAMQHSRRRRVLSPATVLKFKERNNKLLHLEHILVWC
jgi:hypothetical protein